jgi:transposase InsO family protein
MLSTTLGDELNVVADAFSRCVFDNHSTKAYPIQAVATMNEIVLTDEQYNTIGQFHNSTAGHAGIDKTVKRMHKAGISWPYLRELVRAYIRMCPVCQKMSDLKVPIIARRFTTTAAGPMEVLNMDYEGPFPEDEYGNTYVLTLIDTFSRVIGLYAVPNLEARHAARMLVRHIGIVGCPSQIVSDRGTHFTAADIIQELMVLVGTNHVLTLAASKQENAAVENANKRSQECLRSMLFDIRILKRWSDVLPLVQRIMMAEPNDVIGVSHAQLLFGNSIQLDRGIFLSHLPKEGVEAEMALSDWADKMFEAHRVLLETAQRLQQQKDARHMEATIGDSARFDVDSYVFISYNPQKMNAKPPTKLHPRLKGPYLVANVQGDKYSCQNLVTDEIEDYHVTRLREFRYDKRYVDPRDIALRDRDEFYVEKILAHHGDVGRLKTLAFHVQWRGFDESFNSLEPRKTLRETEMLHRYLILHGLQKLIPAKFRENYPELAVGRRRRRQDVAANEEAQMVSAVGLESLLWSSETWAGKRLKIQKKYRKITFAEDLVSYFQENV